jgi:type II secretory pathway component PulJ
VKNTIKILSCVLVCSVALSANAGKEGWIRVGIEEKNMNLYYMPLSIRTHQTGDIHVVSVLNYTNHNGRAESMLTSSLYNCKNNTKQDQSTVQHELHWGDGEVISTSGKEQQWRDVLPRTKGFTLLEVTCATNGSSTQLQR